MSEVPLYARGLSEMGGYMGTSPIRKRTPLGPYARMVSRNIWWPSGGVRFLVSEAPLY